MVRVLCAGHVNWDVSIKRGQSPCQGEGSGVVERTENPGGSAANVARTLAGLDCGVALLGTVGDDVRGASTRERLASAGVDCSGLLTVDGPTTVKHVVVDETGEGEVRGEPGVNEALAPGDVDEEVVREAEHVHLTSQDPRTATHIARTASRADVPVSFDPGPGVQHRAYGPVVEWVDTLICTERELERARAKGYSGAVPEVVVKAGEGGARLERDGERVTDPARPADVVDTTGAGDAFAAGFIAARLQSESDRAALAVGNACGAFAVGTLGTVTNPSWDELDAVLARA